MSIEDIAYVAYEAVRAHQRVCGDPVNPPWAEAEPQARESAVHGAEMAAAGRPGAERHAEWLTWRRAEGWQVGAVKDPAGRVSPFLVPWPDLPERGRRRSEVFGAVASALS
jgi:hypothetical protein